MFQNQNIKKLQFVLSFPYHKRILVAKINNTSRSFHGILGIVSDASN